MVIEYPFLKLVLREACEAWHEHLEALKAQGQRPYHWPSPLAQAAATVLSENPDYLAPLVVPDFATALGDVGMGIDFMCAVHLAIEEGLIALDRGAGQNLFKETQAYILMQEAYPILPAIPLGREDSFRCLAVLQKKKYSTVRSTFYKFVREVVTPVDAWLDRQRKVRNDKTLISLDLLSYQSFARYIADTTAVHATRHTQHKVTVRIYQAAVSQHLRDRGVAPPISDADIRDMATDFKSKLSLLHSIFEHNLRKWHEELQHQTGANINDHLNEIYQDGLEFATKIEDMQSENHLENGAAQLVACLSRLYPAFFSEGKRKEDFKKRIIAFWN